MARLEADIKEAEKYWGKMSFTIQGKSYVLITLTEAVPHDVTVIQSDIQGEVKYYAGTCVAYIHEIASGTLSSAIDLFCKKFGYPKYETRDG